MSDSPLVPNLPRSTVAFTNKYSQLSSSPTFLNLPTHVRGALVSFDRDRVLSGQNPLSLEQTALVARAIQGLDATPGRERNSVRDSPFNPINWLGNTVRDLGNIVRSLPRLPAAVAREVTLLPQLPAMFGQTVANASGPLDLIGDIAELPGIRMAPLSYIVENLAHGDPSELARNPVTTLLDALPVAGKVAAGTKVGKLAPTEGLRPLRAVLTRRLDEAGDIPTLRPNALSQTIDALANTRPGQSIADTVGPTARQFARLRSAYDLDLRDRARIIEQGGTKNLNDPISDLTRQASTLAERHNIPPERITPLTQLAERLRPGDDLPNLPDNEIAFLDEAREIGESFAPHTADTSTLAQFGGEWYDASTQRVLFNHQQRRDGAILRVENQWLPRLRELQAARKAPNERVQRLITAIESQDWTAARQAIQGLTRSRVRLGERSVGPESVPRGDMMIAAVRNMQNDIRQIVASEKLLDRALRRTPPARFRSLVEDEARNRLVARFAEDGYDVDRIVEALKLRAYDGIEGLTDELVAKTLAQAKEGWVELRNAGYDPIFVHRVGRPVNPEYATIKETLPTITQAKKAVGDVSPRYTEDLQVALTQQGLELLAYRGSERFINVVLDTWGKTRQQLVDYFLPEARRTGVDIEQLIDERYAPATLESLKTQYRISRPDLYIPRSIARNLEREAFATNRLTAVFDPAMRLFRTAVLPLSPRWHIYNGFGNFILTAAEIGPVATFRHAGEAVRAIKFAYSNADSQILPRELRLTLSQLVRSHGEMNAAMKARAAGEFSRGRRLAQHAIEEVAKRPPGTVERLIEQGSGVKAPLGNVLRWSYRLNGVVDDFFRAINYLHGREKSRAMFGDDAIVTESVHGKAGIDAVRRAMPMWDDLTPIERSIVRSFFPFYSFTNFIVRYAFRYPADHPLRTSILAHLTNAELTDAQYDLPAHLQGTVFFGEADAEGNQSGFNFNSINPFADIPSFFTLGGLLSTVNPLVSTALQQLGVDTGLGGAEVFPDLRFDPETGRLTTRKPDIVTNTIGNLIPQARALTNMLGLNAEFNALINSNAGAAYRQQLSAIGLPALPRSDYNLPKVMARAELGRQRAANDVWRDALRSGDFREAASYPTLRPAIERLQSLTPEQRERYSPSTYQEALDEQVRALGG